MSGQTSLSRLQSLLENCRVLVTGVTQGTGFLVAPGYVVTCAHVAGSAPGTWVPVVWGGAEYTGVVRAASAAARGDGLWPYPDLAIVELADPPAWHPCVWLDTLPIASGTELTAVGFSGVYDRRAAAERMALLTVGGRHSFQGGPMVELTGGEVNHGLSGGPVLNHRSGGVCAVVKATRKKDTDMGGLGTPVTALRLLEPSVYRELMRAHDRFHLADERWAALSDRVAEEAGGAAATQLAPASARALLGVLAELPVRTEAASHMAAYVAASPEGMPPPPGPPLLDHRDVFTDLAALMPPDPGVLPYELAFAADRTREATRDEGPDAGRGKSGADAALMLRDHVFIAAGELRLGKEARRRLDAGPRSYATQASGTGAIGLGAGACDMRDAAPHDTRPSVVGRIRHSMRDRRLYHVMVWRFRSPTDVTAAGPESDALPLADAVALLSERLPEQVKIMGESGETGLIELILPKEALDEGFPQVRMPPPWESWRLGGKQHVVVRPLERHEAPALRGALERRWRQLDDRTVGEALVCVCGRDAQHEAALGASFELDETLAALALAGSPRSGPVGDAYRVAVVSGVPMMMWHRNSAACERGDGTPCGVPGRQSCTGSFYTAARKHLGHAARDELPEQVRRLRLGALLPRQDGGDHIGEDIVLLWDDPRRQIPPVPLAPAEEGRS
ncbi:MULTISPECIES: trypsin-like peptidase domain-containing protein [Streptomyces]|uniref:Trypsin-like peptidase domain-containing protein n=1 Tax=Streptomyces solicathayae TaxID=3081768 RepID=A0ABZ0LLQ7_9ACTN|nr:trypsin-like peptidase domain-containing protein [Streptomyces sp. HUAS YS2]WOX20440.1 trypsin-like peptidase domain-containing protein [Streptomyces sp. HUAS YS2]